MVGALTLSLLLASSSASTPAVPPACAAAAAPFPDDRLTGKLRAAVEAYRGAWRDACAMRPRPRSLAPLLGRAEALARSADLREAVVGDGEALRALPGLAVDVETSSLLVHHADFVEAAALGTADDRDFLPEYAALAGDAAAGRLPPWLAFIEGSDGAVCVRLGEVSWLDLARRLDALRARTRTPAYRARADRVAAAIAAVLDDLARGRRTCGCAENEHVAPELDPLARADRKGGPVVRRLSPAAAAAAHATREKRALVVWDRGPGQGAGGCRAARSPRPSPEPPPGVGTR